MPKFLVLASFILVAGCGASDAPVSPDPAPGPLGDFSYVLPTAPALNGFLLASAMEWPPPGAHVVAPDLDLFSLTDRSAEIRTINRVTDDSWRVYSPPLLTADRLAAIFAVHQGDAPGIYEFDRVSGRRNLLVGAEDGGAGAGHMSLDGDYVLSWWAPYRAESGVGRRPYLFALDGTFGPAPLAPEGFEDINFNDYDLSDDGDWVVWAASRPDGSRRLAVTPVSDPNTEILLRDVSPEEWIGQPEFLDSDLITYTYLPDGAADFEPTQLFRARRTLPENHIRLDPPSPSGFAAGADSGGNPYRVFASGEGGQYAGFERRKLGTGPEFDDYEHYLEILDFAVPGESRRVNEGVNLADDSWVASPDGHWILWVGRNAGDPPQLYLTDLRDDPLDAVSLGQWSTANHLAYAFTRDSGAVLFTDADAMYRLALDSPEVPIRLADMPRHSHVHWIRPLPDEVHFLLATELVADGFAHGRKLWVGRTGEAHEIVPLVETPSTEFWREEDFVQLP